jgi:hypothetical protein
MTKDDERAEDSADELQEVIDQLTSGEAVPGAPAPTGTRGESLREAVHRRMRELADKSKAEQKHTGKAPESDDEGT